MSLASIVSSALEVSGLKDYVGHVIGGITGWLMDRAYGWWTGRDSRPSSRGIDIDIEQGINSDEACEASVNLESTSLCMVSEFGVLDVDEKAVECCGWSFTASKSKKVVHEK